ncbi:hypothetical protein [Rubritalea tangerina]
MYRRLNMKSSVGRGSILHKVRILKGEAMLIHCFTVRTGRK